MLNHTRVAAEGHTPDRWLLVLHGIYGSGRNWGSIARRLEIPGHLYGQARRVLRDKIKAHDISMGGAGLDLGSRDEQDPI